MKQRDLLSIALIGLVAGLSSCCRTCSDNQISNECGCPTNYDACRNLSCDEMEFANQLTEKNRTIFCSRFSSEERKRAMQASCHASINCGADRNAGKKVEKPNDAVTDIMRHNNMTMEEKRELLINET